DFAAGLGVPQPDRPVLRPGDDEPAVGRELDAVHLAAVAAQYRPIGPGGGVPEAHAAVGRAGGDAPGVGADGDGDDDTLVTAQHRAGAVELAVQVAPLPVAELLRGGGQRPAGAGGVVQLQAAGGGGDVGPVGLPAARVALGAQLVGQPDGPAAL